MPSTKLVHLHSVSARYEKVRREIKEHFSNLRSRSECVSVADTVGRISFLLE